MTMLWIAVGVIAAIAVIFAVGRRRRHVTRGAIGAGVQTARAGQLHIRYPKESAYLSVDVKEIMCISIGQEAFVGGKSNGENVSDLR